MSFRTVNKSNLLQYNKIITYNCDYFESATLKDKKTFIEFISKHISNEFKLRKNSIYSGIQVSHNIIKIPYNKNDYRYFAYKGSIDDDCGTYGIIEKDVTVFDEKGNIYPQKMGLKIIKREFKDQQRFNYCINKVIKEAKFNAQSCAENSFTPVFKITKNSVTAYYPIILFTMDLFQYVIRNRKELPFVYLLKILSQIAHIIQTNISAKGIVHADINPNNIFVRANPKNPLGLDIKIGDFGLATEHGGGQAYGALLPFDYLFTPGLKTADKLDDAFAFGFMNYILWALWLGPNSAEEYSKINKVLSFAIQHYVTCANNNINFTKVKAMTCKNIIGKKFAAFIDNLRKKLLKKTGINEKIFNEYWVILEKLTTIERNKRISLAKADQKLTAWLKIPVIASIPFPGIAELNKKMRQRLTTANYYYEKGQLFWGSHHKNSTALACYAKAVAINPKHIDALVKMAEINVKLKKYAISHENLDKAIAALADDPSKYAKILSDIYFKKAQVYCLQKNSVLAIKHCESAIQYNSKNQQANALLTKLNKTCIIL